MRTDLNSTNDVFALIQEIVLADCYPFIKAISSARRLWYLKHSLLIAPVVINSTGGWWMFRAFYYLQIVHMLGWCWPRYWYEIWMRDVMSPQYFVPIDKRISFKILLMTFTALNGQSPVYISELISRYQPTALLNLNYGHIGLLLLPLPLFLYLYVTAAILSTFLSYNLKAIFSILWFHLIHSFPVLHEFLVW